VAAPAPGQLARDKRLTNKTTREISEALAGLSFPEGWKYPAHGKSQPEQFA
jgi:hypothetical protein